MSTGVLLLPVNDRVNSVALGLGETFPSRVVAGTCRSWAASTLVMLAHLITVMLIVDAKAHWAEVGVNVYVLVPVDEAEMVPGLQVPVMPFVDVPGNLGALAYWQRGPI